MLTGERRGASARRGMTVLGKIPAVPKPINLPSQRLENRGLDPNVEIVPRGSVSWGAAGRSPPTSGSPWGNSTQASSPPVGNGPWGSGPKPGPPQGTTSGPWAANASRPSSAGSGPRPSSAGSIGQIHEAPVASNAWGSATGRPSSASGVLGQAQSQPPVPRPRSAETRTLNGPPPLTRFADHPNRPPSPATAAWGGAGTARKLSEDTHSLHQPARFTLTRGDFPTLGSEKNPDLRPQQNKGGSPAERPGSGDGKGFPSEERPPPGPGGPYDDMPPTGPVYGGQERMPEGWRRDAGPYGGHPGMGDGAWHRDGPPHPPPHGGGQHQPETWRRDPGHGAAPGGGPSDDNWRRTGPPVGPYGPPGPGRFQHEGFMHQQRYGPAPGPGPYGRGGGPGPGGFTRHGEMYGNAGPYARPGGAPPPRPGPPMGPGMYQGPGPYDNYYGPPGVPGPGYGNMDEREMMMLGMGGGPPGMYNNFPQGPPEPFGRFPHGGPGPGPRHMQQNNSGMMRDRNEGMGYEGEGFRESLKYKEGPNFKESGGFKDGYSKDSGYTRERPASAGEVRREGHSTSSGSGSGSKMPRPSSARGRDHGGHRDWAAAASNDEPMDWTKRPFEEDVTSASPGLSKQSSTVSRSGNDVLPAGDDVRTSDQGTRRDHSLEPPASDEKKGWTGSGDNRDEPAPQMINLGTDSKSDTVQTWRQIDVDSHGGGPKARAVDNTPQETRDGGVRTTLPREDIDTTDKRPVKDGMSSGPISRDRSFGREHAHSPQAGRSGVKRDSSSSHAGANTAPAVRSTQHGFLGANNKLNLANSPRVPTSEVVAEEGVSSPVVEKHVSCPASPSGSDSQRNSERLRILKRAGEGPDSPHKDVNTETVHVEVPLEPKDDLRLKSKSASSTHDGEKEWRPKAPLTVADATLETGRSSVPTSKKQSAPSSVLQSVPPAATDPSDKAAADAEVSTDSYDYDAQRARMREIAAQRAKQLRKEEEERSKEQKAKALAKLEELNRRSSSSPVTQSTGQPVGEVNHQVPTASTADESEVVPSEEVVREGVVNESGGTGASTPRGGVRSGSIDHGKRERVIDRKGSGRSRVEHRGKVGAEENREPPKPRLNVPLGQTKMDAPLLPSPSQQPSTPAAVPLPSVSVPHVQQAESLTGPQHSSASETVQIQHQAPSKAQDARHRGKQFVSQTKQMGKQSPATEEGDFLIGQETVPSADSTGKAGGWTGGSPLDLDPKDASLGLVAGHLNNEAGAVAFRKKKSKSSGRNKQRLEIGTSVTDGPSGEVNQAWNIGSSTVNDSSNEMGKVERDTAASAGDHEPSKVMPPTTVVKEAVSIDLKLESGTGEQNKDTGIESGGSDVGSAKHNGDTTGKRSQRGKTQPARRVVRGEKGTSQDVRVADKPHAGEGLVWAVRSPSGTHPNGVKGGFGEGTVEAPGVKKDEPPVIQQTARARRAELERYTPKPVVKQHAQQQEEMQQQAGSLPAQQHAPETSVVSGVVDGPAGPATSTEIKFGSEARQAENVTKHGRNHAWRQRGPGGDRGAGPKEAFHAQQVEPAENNTKFQQSGANPHSQQAHPRSRAASSSSSEQPRPMTSPHPKSGAGQVNRQQAPTFSMEKELPNAQFSHQGRGHHSNPPAQPPVSTNREHKTPQDNLPPYQLPRHASSQLSRGVETEGQSSHDHSRSQRGNALQIDRLNSSSGKYDREFHTLQDRPASHHQPRHTSKHHGGTNSYERDQVHSGVVNSQRFSSQTTADGVPSGEKGQASDPTTGAGQGRPASQPVYGRQSAPTSGERERSPSKPGILHQGPRSPGRQRSRQHTVFHERDQTGPPHHHHQSRYRQSGQEREHHREVSNAVHQQRTPSEGHWQQTGGATDREQTSDLGHSYQHSGRTTHKVQSFSSTELEQGSVSHPGSHHYTRSESSSKPHGSVQGDGNRPSHYQPGKVFRPEAESIVDADGSEVGLLEQVEDMLTSRVGESSPPSRGREWKALAASFLAKLPARLESFLKRSCTSGFTRPFAKRASLFEDGTTLSRPPRGARQWVVMRRSAGTSCDIKQWMAPHVTVILPLAKKPNMPV
ncbi:hypothetical protein R1sor_000041 [Riccia sorocarpa]|uniref:BAT2 N-terminal domain-containing protein n=1 Tax=Riccia sorocarpa TaxID=122646 RepID=A0ABD3GUG8_9MARC